MFRVKFKFVLLMVIAYVFAYLQGGNLPYTVFYGFSITFIFGLVCLISNRSLTFIDVKFEKKIYSSGDKDRFTMIVQNNSIIPAPYVTIKNHALIGLNNKYNGEIISLRLDENKWLKHEVSFTKRGVYNFGEISLHINDIFCIFETSKNLDRKMVIKVYPRVYNLEKTIFRGSDIFKNAVTNKSNIEDMYTIKDIRKYRDGDNLKRINWKVSAKYNELYVKNFDTVSGQEFNLFLDMNKKNYDLDDTGLLEESMIDFCVSMISHMVNKEVKSKVFINAERMENFEIEEKVDFDKLMEYFLTHKSDSEFNFIKFINSNVYHISSLSGVGVILAQINGALASNLMVLHDRGYKISVFYCGNSPEEQKNVDLLEKVGIGCYSILNMMKEHSNTRIG